MAPRRRLGVALMIDAPLADELNGLRRALGDRALGRIEPHVTLVPPVNVHTGDIPAALDIVRGAARACGRPMSLTLGPPATFAPANPVIHLPVSGDAAPLRRLRDAIFDGPLRRPLSWPWVPHVTLADGADPADIQAAVGVLAHFTAVAVIDRVVVLEERRAATGRKWEPFADAALNPGALVGRGGLDLRLVQGRVVDPDAAALLADAGHPVPGAGTPPGAPIVVTGLVGALLVGVAVAWRSDGGGRIAVVVAPGRRGSGLGRQLLVHTEAAVRAAGWDCPVLTAPPPAGFYEACSRWSVTPATGGRSV